MKKILFLLAIIPVFAIAGGHGGKSAEHGGKPAATAEHGGKAAKKAMHEDAHGEADHEAHEHGGKPAKSSEHGGKPAKPEAEAAESDTSQ